MLISLYNVKQLQVKVILKMLIITIKKNHKIKILHKINKIYNKIKEISRQWIYLNLFLMMMIELKTLCNIFYNIMIILI